MGPGGRVSSCQGAWRGGAGSRGVGGAEKWGQGHGFGCRAGRQAPAPATAPAQMPERQWPSLGSGGGEFQEKMVNRVWNYLSVKCLWTPRVAPRDWLQGCGGDGLVRERDHR